jgi:hypothetical protein
MLVIYAQNLANGHAMFTIKGAEPDDLYNESKG